MHVEQAFTLSGSFGKFQVAITLINFSANIVFGSQMVLMVIAGATPNRNISSEADLNTIITEWNLYGKQWIVDLVEGLFMGGFIFGTVLFGQLPDLYGRKPVLMLNFCLTTVCCFCSSFCNNYKTFAVTRFLGGLFAGGCASATFVLLCELIGRKMWGIVGMLYQVFFAIGMIELSLLGYLLRDWRQINMVSCGLVVIFFPLFYFFVPESPRWLYSVGRLEDAQRVMQMIARKNGRDPSDIILTDVSDGPQENLRKYTLLDVLKMHKAAFRLLICCYLWFGCSLAYYGLTLNAADLAKNIYVAVVLSGSVEIPAYIITMILMDRVWIGRKGTTLFLLLLSSIGSVGILFLHDADSPVKTGLGLLSKLSVAGAFSLLYIYVSELFPAQIRVLAIGASSMFARVGAIVAPFVPLLASTHFYLPYLVFGIITLIGAASTLYLPDTVGGRMVSMGEFCDQKENSGTAVAGSVHGENFYQNVTNDKANLLINCDDD